MTTRALRETNKVKDNNVVYLATLYQND